MMSIGKINAGIMAYFTAVGPDSYYASEGSEAGRWKGQGAPELGFNGRVQVEQLQSLADQICARSQTTQNQNQKPRRLGLDLTLSAPKGLSAYMTAVSDAEFRAILDCHERAVDDALAAVERLAGFTRRGKLGHARERVHLTFACFTHLDSREHDPHLHTHALLLNLARRADGSFGAVDTKLVYLAKMAAGAVYRCSLANLLQKELGLAIEKHGSLFDIAGIPSHVLEAFSKRSQVIKRAIGSVGYTSAAAKAIATLETREPKVAVTREELRAQWQQQAQELGFEPSRFPEMFTRGIHQQIDPDQSVERAVVRAAASLEVDRNFFHERDLVRTVAEDLLGAGVSGRDIVTLTPRAIDRCENIVTIGVDREETILSTVPTLEVEQRLLDTVDALVKSRGVTVRETTMLAMDEKYASFSEEQRRGYRHLASSPEQIRILEGIAGSGKTQLLRALAESFERTNARILGCSPTGKATKGLEQSTGIKSYTIHRLLTLLDRTTADQAQHVVQQLVRAARQKPTFTSEHITLGKGDVLVVDEPGMVGVRAMSELLSKAKQRGFTVILSGDSRQLQPVLDLGGAFAGVIQRVGSANMSEVRRQRDEWAREAVKDVAEGKAHEALQKYLDHDLLDIAPNYRESMSRLLKDWLSESLDSPKGSLVLLPTNEQVAHANRSIQQARRERRDIGLLYLRVGDDQIHVGDRIVCTENSSLLGVSNGSFGTVRKLDVLHRKITLDLDDGTSAVIPLKHYSKLQLGYACTVHRSQGATVDRCYVMLGGAMLDREMAYVQLSRARQVTKLYTNRWETGEHLQELARRMSQSRRQELAHDIQRRLQPEVGY